MKEEHNVFVYGTLMIPEILLSVTDRIFPGEDAVLQDFGRFCVAGESYPGIKEEAGAFTAGILYGNVDPESLSSMDSFEGDQYERRLVTVLDKKGREHRAFTYVIAPSYVPALSDHPWSLDQFKAKHLVSFMSLNFG